MITNNHSRSLGPRPNKSLVFESPVRPQMPSGHLTLENDRLSVPASVCDIPRLFFVICPNREAARLYSHWFLKASVPEIRKRIAAPAPEGWALQISETVLRHTRALFFSGASNAATEEMLDTLKDMQPFTDLTNLNGVRHGLAHSLHLAAMHLVQRDPKSKDLKTVLANIQRLAALEFKRQQLELQHEKLRSRRSH